MSNAGTMAAVAGEKSTKKKKQPVIEKWKIGVCPKCHSKEVCFCSYPKDKLYVCTPCGFEFDKRKVITVVEK